MSNIRTLLESFDAIESGQQVTESEDVTYETIEEFEECMGEISQLLDQAYDLIP